LAYYCYWGSLVNYRNRGNLRLNKLEKGLIVSAWLIILTGLIYAYIAIEQAFKGNMGLACMYSGYCFANYGAYLIATK
jgi:hypothetical protein